MPFYGRVLMPTAAQRHLHGVQVCVETVYMKPPEEAATGAGDLEHIAYPVVWKLDTVPADFRRKAGCSLDRSPTRRRTTIHTHIYGQFRAATSACLWTVKGNRSAQRKPAQRKAFLVDPEDLTRRCQPLHRCQHRHTQ